MNRRRFFKISGSALAGLALQTGLPAASDLNPIQFRAFALGAEGTLSLFSSKRNQAYKDIQICLTEVRRLEKIFSLLDPNSELSHLNKTGKLENPSNDWHFVLDTAAKVNEKTNALFDPTVQPYWIQQKQGANEDEKQLPTVGWSNVDFNKRRIKFVTSDMKMTLNGIAQGYITDRITNLLKNLDYQNALVELGETRAIGSHPFGPSWNIGIKSSTDESNELQSVALSSDEAIATSGNSQLIDGKSHHFLPSNGSTKTRWSSLSVIAPTAIEADAYSTGLLFADESLISTIQKQNSKLKILYS